MDEMRYGNITCECGQYFNFESLNSKVRCISCGKEFDVTSYPVKDSPPVIEGEPDGTDI